MAVAPRLSLSAAARQSIPQPARLFGALPLTPLMKSAIFLIFTAAGVLTIAAQDKEPVMPALDETRGAQITNGVTYPGNTPRTSALRKEIRLTAGGAAADFGRLKVYFDANPASARPVRITTPAGGSMACRATYLAAYNTASDECLLLATLTNALGLIVSPSELLYTNSFDNLHAHLRYGYERSGISLVQDVILLEKPRLPASFTPENTRLEIWTEWFDANPISISAQNITLRPASDGVAEVIAEDQTPDFGFARLASGGRVFSIAAPQEEFPVAKTWTRIAAENQGSTNSISRPVGGTFLIESVDYSVLKPALEALPEARNRSAAAPVRGRSEFLRRLAAAPAPFSKGRVLLAQAAPIPNSAVVFDFTLICPVPPPADLVSWWPAAYDALDAMTAGNNGTLMNGATFAPGKVGPAFSLDGTQNVEISDSFSLNPTAAITLDAWVYVTGGQGASRDIISKDGKSSDRQYLLGVSTNDIFRARIGVTNTFYYIDGTNTVSLNTWYHVAMTYNGETLVLYVNGVPEAASSIPGTILTGDQPLRIGGGAPQGSPGDYFAGLIDEPDIFSRALSATEVASIYSAGSAGR